jgi:hypothetical protein
VELTAAWGPDEVAAALERALMFRPFTAADLRSILTAGTGVAQLVDEGVPVALDLPQVAMRELPAYALEELS